MLSAEQKTRIEQEEQYRNELQQKRKPRSSLDLVETSIKILQGLAIIAGIWATWHAYQKQNEDRRMQERLSYEQTAKEFRRGFYEKQFEYYTEAAEVVATLATEEIGSKDYVEARKKFDRLFWGRLSIVEDKTVEAKMVIFQRLLLEYENRKDEVTRQDLQQASLDLAHAASKYTISVWLDSAERRNYNR